MSAPPGPAPTTLAGRWELDPDVGLRTERFGALAYHYRSRRLTFLGDPRLVRVLRLLSGCRDVEAALDAAAIPTGHRTAFRAALERLATAAVIRRVGA